MTTVIERIVDEERRVAKLTEELQQAMSAQCIPDHMRRGLLDYAVHHRPVGGFLMALFENDFIGAVSRADTYNERALRSWMLVVCMMPSGSYGSKDKVLSWLMNEPAIIVECDECEQSFEFESVADAIAPAEDDEGLASWACPNCGAENISAPKPVGAPQSDDPPSTAKESS